MLAKYATIIEIIEREYFLKLMDLMNILEMT